MKTITTNFKLCASRISNSQWTFILLLMALTHSTFGQTTASNGIITTPSNTNLRLRTNSSTTDRLIILNAAGSTQGHVGIGITPTEKLHVNGNTLANDFIAANGAFNSTNSTALYLRTMVLIGSLFLILMDSLV